MIQKNITVLPTEMTTTLKHSKTKISKREIVFKILKCLRFMIGHYTELMPSKTKSFVIKCYSILIAISIVYAPMKYIKVAYVMGLIEYLLFILLSIVTGDEYFFNFYKSLNSVDIFMGYKNGMNLDSNIIIVLMSCVLILRLIVIYCRSTVLPFSMALIGIYLAIVSLRINYMLVVVIFYAIYHRVKFLRRKLEANVVPVNIMGKDKMGSKIRLIRKCFVNYHNLLDCLRDTNGGLQYFWAIMIGCNIPKYIYFGYSAIKLEALGRGSLASIVQNVEMLEGFLFVIAPALFSELTTLEVERIIDIVNRQLLRCSDSNLEFELQVALECIKRRPFKYVIWRAIPLNASMPVAIISLCITYVIILIQLTQFHDNF